MFNWSLPPSIVTEKVLYDASVCFTAGTILFN